MEIYSLKDGFGLLVEYSSSRYFISLIFLDLYQRILKKLHTIEYSSYYINILINKTDPNTFILDDRAVRGRSTRICKIVDKTIVIGDVVDIGFHPDWFYDKCVYSLKWYDEDPIEVLDVRILYMLS
jgi:hypothetical protein